MKAREVLTVPGRRRAVNPDEQETVRLKPSGCVATIANTSGSYSMFLDLSTLGFPAAVLLAWAFEATPEGIKRDATATGNTAVGYQSLRAATNAGVDNTALGYGALDQSTTSESPCSPAM